MNESISVPNQESEQDEIKLQEFRDSEIPNLMEDERREGKTMFLQTLAFNPAELTKEDMEMYNNLKSGAEEISVEDFHRYQDPIWRANNSSRQNFSAYLWNIFRKQNHK